MARTKEERVHDVFESISGQYDKMNAIISFKRHLAWRKDTMKKMAVPKGASALDVCCGTADWTIHLAEAVGINGKVRGLDFSENMLSVGKEKVTNKKLNQIKLIHGNAMELPFKDNEFDFVTIGFGLRNVPDYLQVLKEMRRVVKPNGTVVCLETSQPTAFGFKQIYWLYFKHVMPLFGKVFAKSYDEYSWLQESSQSFPGKEELKSLFKEAGFEDITYKSYSGGVAASHFAKK
ncbi:bifunctional demethylmenaquinone methyltransferase/2-methoxy-6-polyprenyl-1,4-benzoquinol methylase [Salipaludibacillus neizhouensis]|uniref:Demethylmenaquinone methyltransferase n=1 Tax=Salipaludibacillus neizhouensis TaxID=885475 RepID=A0A3A9KIS7_9BACI|nr:demethylmenaquinone methyltransferase [Salipaludibacillus neizhouensis]RKL67595.1 bifunctional demethylmenaquinone methyltransferase/2-methoxy-6-polyprenyl-1,4-benzoquinol methylase [Salipaludibacillus neizhouensis]